MKDTGLERSLDLKERHKSDVKIVEPKNPKLNGHDIKSGKDQRPAKAKSR